MECPEYCAGLGEFFGRRIFEQAEVIDFPYGVIGLCRDEYVLWLEVAMDESFLVNVCHCVEQREKLVLNGLQGECCLLAEGFDLDFSTIAPFENTADDVVIRDEVEDADNMRVVDLVLESCFS